MYLSFIRGTAWSYGPALPTAMFEKFQLVRADRSFKESIELYMKSYGRTDISDWQIGDCLDVGNKMRYAYTWS